MNIEDKLIGAVKAEPVLYNKRLKSYKSNSCKVKAWRRVSLKVGIKENKCQKKWKNLRDQYVRVRNYKHSSPGRATTKKKEWKFFKDLSFLEDHVAGGKKSSNMEISEGEAWTSSTPATQEIPNIKQIINDESNLAADRISLEDSNSSGYSASFSTPEFSLPSTSRQNNRRKDAEKSDKVTSLNNFYKELSCSIKSEYTAVDLYFQNLAKVVTAEKLSNFDFLDLQVQLTSFLREQLKKYKNQILKAYFPMFHFILIYILI